MRIHTSRFGSVEIQADDILLFPCGLVGYEHARHWVLLADESNSSVGWLQSVSDPQLALPVVSPRRFVRAYQVRVAKRDIAALSLDELNQAHVLCVISRSGESLTANLRAPLIINLERHLGRQIVTVDDQPLQFVLGPAAPPLRKSA